MPHNKGPPRKGADDASGPPKGVSRTSWGRPGHQCAKYYSTLKNIGGRVGGGGGVGVEAEVNCTKGGGVGKPNLAAIVQARVGASLTAAMEGVEDVMNASVEARTTE